jgi:hypothetical protein
MNLRQAAKRRIVASAYGDEKAGAATVQSGSIIFRPIADDRGGRITAAPCPGS